MNRRYSRHLKADRKELIKKISFQMWVMFLLVLLCAYYYQDDTLRILGVKCSLAKEIKPSQRESSAVVLKLFLNLIS